LVFWTFSTFVDLHPLTNKNDVKNSVNSFLMSININPYYKKLYILPL